MLYLLQLLPGALPVALPAILGGGHTLHSMKGLSKHQSISVAAGQRNTFDGIGSGIQKLPGLCDTEGSEKTLGRHSQIILKKCVQIASVNAHIVCHIRHLDGITVVTLNKG